MISSPIRESLYQDYLSLWRWELLYVISRKLQARSINYFLHKLKGVVKLPKGILGAVVILVGLGLVLRFGKDSNALLNSSFSGINGSLGILTLSKFPSNGM